MSRTGFNATVLFTGDLTRPRVRGKVITATLVPGGVAYDQQLPPFLVGGQCNHITGRNPDGTFLMSVGCGLLQAAWKFRAQVTTPISSAHPFELHLEALVGDGAEAAAALAGGAVFANWFANAILETGTGSAIQRRRILTSTALSGLALTVTLDRWFTASPADHADVVLYPQCDGRRESCLPWHPTDSPQGRFDNYLNFGGHPFVPAGNRSALEVTDLNTAGGKK